MPIMGWLHVEPGCHSSAWDTETHIHLENHMSMKKSFDTIREAKSASVQPNPSQCPGDRLILCRGHSKVGIITPQAPGLLTLHNEPALRGPSHTSARFVGGTYIDARMLHSEV